MNEIELNQKTRDLLDCVRHRRKCLSVYEMPADLAEAAVWEIGVPPVRWTPVVMGVA